jgi:hypothetical protein
MSLVALLRGDFKREKPMPTQPDRAGSHLFFEAATSGKDHQIGLYFNCDLFDTPEKRVIPSGRFLASILLMFAPSKLGVNNLAKVNLRSVNPGPSGT